MDVQLHRMQRRQKVLACGYEMIFSTVAECPCSMFLLQEKMLSQPGHCTAQRLHWVFCPGQAEVLGWMESLLPVWVGKQLLALGEGLRLLLGPRQSKAYSSQAFLDQSVSCSR